MATVIKKSDLAERLGLTRGRITQFVKAGMPVLPTGRLDLDEAIATTRQCQGSYVDRGVKLLAEKAADARSARPAPGTVADKEPVAAHEAQHPSYAEARAVRESALAQLAQLKLATERGDLVEIATVKRDWVSTLTSLRGRLLAISARVSAALPHLSQSDVATIAGEVRQALEELSHDAELV